MEYESADVITVPSTFALNTFVECGVPRHKLRLVPYGVDLSAFYPCAQRNDHEFRVLFAGNVAVRKGVRDLLDAFLQLSCERKRLVFVGSISPELESCFRQWRGDSRISALGKVSQPRLKEIMSASDVMVLPSVEEGLALVQAQAMACGCPVIASRRPPMTEVAGEAAILIDPAEPQAAAMAIAAGLKGSEQLRAAGFKNLKRFDAEAIADRYCAFYESILGHAPASAR